MAYAIFNVHVLSNHFQISKDAEENPNQICDDCFKEIENWMRFKEKCSIANVQLKDYIENLHAQKNTTEVRISHLFGNIIYEQMLFIILKWVENFYQGYFIRFPLIVFRSD